MVPAMFKFIGRSVFPPGPPQVLLGLTVPFNQSWLERDYSGVYVQSKDIFVEQTVSYVKPKTLVIVLLCWALPFQ